MIDKNTLYLGDSLQLIKSVKKDSIHLILSDIPYGIGIDDWDVLHDNSNSAYLGSSPAQQKAGDIFKKRGKPLNGWSDADKQIPKQYYDWCMTWASDWLSVLKPGASCFIFAGRRLSHRCITAMEDSGFIFKDMIGWNKEKAAYRAQRISKVFERRKDIIDAQQWKDWRVGNLRPLFEPILWFMKPYKIGATITDNVLQNAVGAFNENQLLQYIQSPDNLMSFKSNYSDIGLHPTQKPLKLMQALIELTTLEGQIVLDPFMGSATTLVAAKLLKREYIGFDNNESYYKIALNRINKANINLFSNQLRFALS
ncbi:MAG: site-specific DNA-methyltransferase [Elusimicrobiota bacterium]|jgi:site-specific DNA-methyltransferase (adenine-specific)|nr:site-specific DNA-methyltransferase [Elusimicrobiota bacterium]